MIISPRAKYLAALAAVTSFTACETSAPPVKPVSFLDQAAVRAEAVPRISSFLVWQNDSVLVERYYRSGSAHRTADVKSVSKSFLSALVGIAINEGYMRENQRVAEILPDYFPPDSDPRKLEITVSDLLSMRSGLQSTSGNAYRAWFAQPDLTRAALEMPMVAQPGTRMQYSTGNSQILSSVLTRVTGVSTHEYARRKLAEPLRIKMPEWPRDATGTFIGGNDMFVSPTALLRLGITYLNRGKFEGKQIVPQTWVDQSLRPRGRSPDSQFLYGYGWWLKEAGTHPVFFAWGYGGQFVFCVPDLRLVAVFTAQLTDDIGDDPQQLAAVHEIVDAVLVPGFANAH